MNERIEQLQDQIEDYLSRLNIESKPTKEGSFLVGFGSTVVVITAFEAPGPSGENSLLLRFVAILLVGVKLKLEVVTRVLRLNTRVLYGAFQLFDDETLCFTHTLLAEGLKAESFNHALLYVGRIADDHDEALQALGGGQRMEELMEEPAFRE
jgi:hypothetical protein